MNAAWSPFSRWVHDDDPMWLDAERQRLMRRMKPLPAGSKKCLKLQVKLEALTLRILELEHEARR